MNDIRYLLSLKELLDSPSAEQLIEQSYLKLDRERKRKLEGVKNKRKYAESLGAGLLLQLGLQKIYGENRDFEKENRRSGTFESESFKSESFESESFKSKIYKCESFKSETDKTETFKTEMFKSKTFNIIRDKSCRTGINNRLQQLPNEIPCVTIPDILAQLKTPIEVTYYYGKNGKPYFQDIPIYFNLSHSEDYVCCVFSEQEIGVDIQYQKPLANDRVVRRFFAEAEQRAWDNCATKEEQKRCFFRLWARKESYGKLTGEGIAAAASVDVLESSMLEVVWEDYENLDSYQIAICKRIGEKDMGEKE